MSAHKHTPGPWRWSFNSASSDATHCIEIVGADRVGHIAYCQSYTKDDYDDREETIANARLITSAPDLLEIVQTFDAYMGHAGEDAEQNSNNPIRALRWKAQQVIAKATGRKE